MVEVDEETGMREENGGSYFGFAVLVVVRPFPPPPAQPADPWLRGCLRHTRAGQGARKVAARGKHGCERVAPHDGRSGCCSARGWCWAGGRAGTGCGPGRGASINGTSSPGSFRWRRGCSSG